MRPLDSGLPGCRDWPQLTHTHYDFSLSGVSSDENTVSSGPPVGWLPASPSRNERALAHEHGWKTKQLERKNDPLDTWKLTPSVKYIKFWYLHENKRKRKKKKKTNLAKGRFIVQPRASVSMTTCSNFEIKWTVDSVRENKRLFCWEEIKQMETCHQHDPRYQTSFISQMRGPGVLYQQYLPSPSWQCSRATWLQFALHKYAPLSMKGPLVQIPSTFDFLCFTFKWFLLNEISV